MTKTKSEKHKRTRRTALILCLPLFASLAHAQESASNFGLTLTEAEKPSTAPAWERPASLSFTLNDDGEDVFAVHANGKYALRPRNGRSLYARIALDKDDQIKKPQDNLALKVGMDFEKVYPGASIPSGPIEGVGNANTVERLPGLYLSGKLEAGFNQQTKFNDIEEKPALPKEEDIQSFRITGDVSPWWDHFQYDGTNIDASFAFSGGVYYDQITEGAIDETSGEEVKGETSGALLSAGFKLATNEDKKFQISVNAQVRQGLSATGLREAETEGLLKITTEYFFTNPPSVVKCDKCPKRFRPSVGLELSSGEDSLMAIENQTSLKLALRLGFF